MVWNIKMTTVTGTLGRKFFAPSAFLWMLFASSAAQSSTPSTPSTLVTTYMTFSSVDNGKTIIDGNILPPDYGWGAYRNFLADTGMLNVSAEPESTKTGEIPLPTAVWLFGSALVGFVILSNKRSV